MAAGDGRVTKDERQAERAVPRPLGFWRLALRSVGENAVRSWIIFICAALVAGFALVAALVVGGAHRSLGLAAERLGADILVVPDGLGSRIESALLMGLPTVSWMPASVVDAVRGVSGVEAASPQIYLSTLRGATCCSLPEMFLIAYDPATDFTLRPWLDSHLNGGLALGDAVGGSLVYVPEGDDKIRIYGYDVELRGNLGPTGTGMDQSMFLTFETAREAARVSVTEAEQVLDIRPDSVSAVLVRVARGADSAVVAAAIEQEVEGVTAIESNGLFQEQRRELDTLVGAFSGLLGATWVLCTLATGFVYAIAANERRRQLGVLRALGSTRGFVLRALLAEGAILALGGAIFGVVLLGFAVYLFHDLLAQSLALPFLLPSVADFLLPAAAAAGAALLSTGLAAVAPSLRVAYLEPATAMRD
ncbi:MAG: ABC transporter permease [Anaerolineae bacterium]